MRGTATSGHENDAVNRSFEKDGTVEEVVRLGIKERSCGILESNFQ